MIERFIATVFILFASAVVSIVWGQAPTSIKPVYIAGELVSMSASKLTVAAKTGNVDVVTTESTAYKRVPPDKVSIAAATGGKLTDISIGDKLTISALPTADGKGFTARTVYFSTKADLAAKNAKEAEEWRTRGISGKVVSVNTETNQIGIETGSLMNKTSVTVTPKTDAKVLRYAADSVKFADARPSSLDIIKPGDQLRALGDRSQDGTTFAAETVLTGGFRQMAGTVVSVDTATKEAVIKDVATNKDVTVSFGDAVFLKRFPEEMVQRLLAMQTGGPGGIRPAGAPTTTGQTAQAGQGPAGSGPRGPINGGGRGLDEMVERAPNITAADLKAGEMIAILTGASDASQTTVGKLKAIKLIAGVEPFVRIARATNNSGGPRRGQGVSGDFSIPGLDGTGF
ncbi:MAG: hypothetical protein KBD94_03085 [Pyrinomonadaceae bacterium]|nr:hypothetical protein [Pyrinomonadaceae bacterium]